MSTQLELPELSTTNGLRRRARRAANPTTTTTTATQNEGEDDGIPLPPQYAAGLRVPHLWKHAQQTGRLYVLHVPLYFEHLLPQRVQIWLLQQLKIQEQQPSSSSHGRRSWTMILRSFLLWCLSGWLLPHWTCRLVLVVGRYLYQFPATASHDTLNDDNHNHKKSLSPPPVARPIPLEAIQLALVPLVSLQDRLLTTTARTATTVASTSTTSVPVVSSSASNDHHHQPELYETTTPLSSSSFLGLDASVVAWMPPPTSMAHQVLAVSTTLTETTYFAMAERTADSPAMPDDNTHDDEEDEIHVWFHALHQARGDAWKRSMGHAPTDSYPPAWQTLDRLGDLLLQTHDRFEGTSTDNIHLHPNSRSSTDLDPARMMYSSSSAMGGGGYFG